MRILKPCLRWPQRLLLSEAQADVAADSLPRSLAKEMRLTSSENVFRSCFMESVAFYIHQSLFLFQFFLVSWVMERLLWKIFWKLPLKIYHEFSTPRSFFPQNFVLKKGCGLYASAAYTPENTVVFITITSCKYLQLNCIWNTAIVCILLFRTSRRMCFFQQRGRQMSESKHFLLEKLQNTLVFNSNEFIRTRIS